MRNKLKFKFVVFIFVFLFFFSLTSWAMASQLEGAVYLDKEKLVTQQINLLKTRLVQANSELTDLQHRQDAELDTLTVDRVNKQMLSSVGLDIAVAKSNLDSIGIELAEAQQTISRLEKDKQEIENQLNAFNIFGMEVAQNNLSNLNDLHAELRYQNELLALENTRAESLLKLQTIANDMLQLFKARHARIDALLKSQTVMQLKERQAKSELAFQQQQSYWLEQVNTLHHELSQKQAAAKPDKVALSKIENELFFANENLNYTYLQMLIARYQDQLQQLRISISRSTSITLLNKMGEQTQVLVKQVARVSDLLKDRMTILGKRKRILLQAPEGKDYLVGIQSLEDQYKSAIASNEDLNQQLSAFRVVLEQALKQELASRQGLPAFGVQGWFDIGAELLIVPTLAFQVTKNLSMHVLSAIKSLSLGWLILLGFLEVLWAGLFYFLNKFLNRAVMGVPDHEFGHVNLKWLGIKLFDRTLIDIAILGNIFGLLYFFGVPAQNYIFLIHLALVWVFFKALLTVARLCLVETVHDRAGHDVRLYHRLKWTFLVGGVITALTVFIHQLPVIYEVKDLFIRLFLLFLLMVSIFLLKSWELLPGLILPHIDAKHTYLKKVIRLVCLLIPLILFVNSAVGLFGYVNLVLTISWYEGVFLIVLIGYLSVRGLLNEAMDFFSNLLIRHMTNGWLWMEAFLKPFDKVLRVILFLVAWAILFLCYGWDQQSPVVERLTKVLNYHLFDLLGSPINLMRILELLVWVAVLYWAARWTREFVYRMLLSRTRDMGIRNSIAILSQYTMIVIGLFICMRVLGIDFRALAVVAGAFAFGVGLGLRDIANNFVCGFVLLIERPLRVGDTVTINGYEGEVIHIGGRAVTIRTWDHMEVLVPNAEIFSKTFTNWTARDNIVRTVIEIKIDRQDNPPAVQALIYEVLQNHKDILKEPLPEVYLKELTDGVTQFEVRYFINLRQVHSRTCIRSEVLVAIWEAFERAGVRPPYPHREILMRT